MSPASLVQDKVSLNAHVLPRISRLKLIQVTPDHLESIIVDLKKKGLASATISRILSPVSAIFNYFIRRRAIQFNPMMALDRRRLLKIEKQDFDFWSLEEVRKFLQYTFQKYAGTALGCNYLFYKAALNTGLRLGELRALSWSDIDFKNTLITVRHSYCDRKQDIKLPKSGKIRHVPISARSMTISSRLIKIALATWFFTRIGKWSIPLISENGFMKKIFKNRA